MSPNWKNYENIFWKKLCFSCNFLGYLGPKTHFKQLFFLWFSKSYPFFVVVPSPAEWGWTLVMGEVCSMKNGGANMDFGNCQKKVLKLCFWHIFSKISKKKKRFFPSTVSDMPIIGGGAIMNCPYIYSFYGKTAN